MSRTIAAGASLVELSAVELRRRIGAREISPVDLMEACIARIDAFEPAVNALAARNFERALRLARAAEGAIMRGERLGALHGLPLGVAFMPAVEGIEL